MIIVNRIGNMISVSVRDKEYGTVFSKEKFDRLMEISEESNVITSMGELEALEEEVKSLTKDNYKERVEAFHPEIFVNPITKEYFVKLSNGAIPNIPMPQVLVDRIEKSIEKEITVDPIIKNWKRFLRNKKASNKDFARRYAEYINLIYIDPKKKSELLDQGLSVEIANDMAKTYEVKITKEGLIACYKTSQEVEHKFVPDEDGNPKKVNRYEKKFDGDTGEILGDNREDLAAEQRLFMPKIMGNSGDAFYCEGPNGFEKPGHFIKVGCTHRLPDWSYVDTQDHVDCVKGLHVGGLGYIDQWGGEIHTVLVDPMHIGAIPDYSGSKAIRVLQYFVYGSLVTLNHSIYHSSEYAAKTDEEWAEVASKIAEEHEDLRATLSEEEKVAAGLSRV